MIKKYAVEDNCWAKLETSIDATATKIRIKETHNLPQSWEWIATLVKKQGDETIKMEKVLVVKRELNLLTVQRGFQSTAQAWEENDVINLYITAEIIREIQRGLDKKADLIDGKVPKSQIPEVSLDESNLVHKSWDEVIEGNKTFSNVFSLSSKTNLTIDKQLKIGTRYQLSNIKHDAGGHITQVIRWDLWSSPEWGLSDWGRWLEFWSHKAPFVKMSVDNVEIWHPTKKKQLIVNDQNRTGARDNYTPTRIGWANGIIEARMCKYKKIWKTIFVESFIKFICSSWAAYLDLSAPVQSRNGGRYPLNIHWEQKITRGFNYAGITTILCAFESWVSYDIAFTYIAEIE